MSSLSSKMLLVSLATSALLAMAVGCGGDDSDSTGTGGRGGSGGSSSGGSGGTGGETGGTGGTGATGGSTGGSGGSGGSAGTGGSIPDGGDIVCNGTVCPPVNAGGVSIPACCTMQNTCGVSVGGGGFCIGTSLPEGGGGGFDAGGGGVIDPTCSSAMLGQMTLAGCCMTDNTCGFNTQFGCVTYALISRLPGVTLPDGGPMTCTYVPPSPAR